MGALIVPGGPILFFTLTASYRAMKARYEFHSEKIARHYESVSCRPLTVQQQGKLVDVLAPGIQLCARAQVSWKCSCT